MHPMTAEIHSTSSRRTKYAYFATPACRSSLAANAVDSGAGSRHANACKDERSNLMGMRRRHGRVGVKL
eukprot:361663-Chlamydomonas_euryale.AAC.9